MTDGARASKQAEEIVQLFATPFALSGEPIHVGANIGIAISRTHGTRAEELLANADLALQSAKSAFGSGYQFFKPSLRRAVMARRTYEAELRQALKHSQFELFYQPQVRLADRKLIGAEALLRWRHPERGLLVPSDFLAVLESSALAAAGRRLGPQDRVCAGGSLAAHGRARFSHERELVRGAVQQRRSADPRRAGAAAQRPARRRAGARDHREHHAAA